MKTKVLLLALVAMLAMTATAQTPPQFKGGRAAMRKWISEHIQYPAEATERGGVVELRVRVDVRGMLTVLGVEESMGPAFDNEAKRLARAMPAWQPATANGRPIAATVPLVINFERQTKKVASWDEIADSKPVTNRAERDEVVEAKPTEKSTAEGTVSIALVEQKPQFPGGDAAMYKWIGEHMKYPEAAAQAGIQGRVVVSFIVEKDGSVSNVKVLRGKDPDLDKEAVRVVRSMPRWQPGKMNGTPVRVTYMLPLNFKLQSH